LGAWITDFQKSDAPQFSGKSKEERQKMAIAAFVDAGGKLEQKEELEEKVNKDDVTKLLVKYGNNPKEVERMVSKEFDRAVKTYPQATAKKIAEIIRVLAEEGDLDKACWKGYKAVGMKDKDGKKVPNCVPESVNEEGPEKTDMQKGQDDKKKTRIAQLQLQIAKATETLNKLKSQGE
jgi:hypothetical protein